jgi:hypothetical protein
MFRFWYLHGYFLPNETDRIIKNIIKKVIKEVKGLGWVRGVIN